MKKLLSILCLVSLFPSCTLHPPYCRPEECTPCTWRVPVPCECPDDYLCWWNGFKDPQLDELICLALNNNQDIKTAIYRVDAFLANLQIVNSQLYPQINAELSAEREKISGSPSIATIPGVSTTENLFSVILNASYFADIWGRIRSASEAALAEVYEQVETRRAVVLSVISSVAISYFRLRQYDMQLIIAKETYETRKEYLYLAEVRYALGLTSKLQVEQATAELQDAETTIQQLEISIGLEEDLLSILIGEPPRKIERGKILSEIMMPPKIPSYLPSDLLNQRPDVLAAEQRLIAANARIGVAKAQFFPQITLTGFLGTESTQLSDLLKSSSYIWQYGVNILQEIFTGGKLTGQLNLARAEKESLIHNYLSTILTAFKEVNDALISHQKTLELISIQKEKVDTLKDYLRLSTLRYTEGETDYLTVLDAQRRLFTAELEYAGYLADGFTTLVQIYQSLGGGWVLDADHFSKESECAP